VLDNYLTFLAIPSGTVHDNQTNWTIISGSLTIEVGYQRIHQLNEGKLMARTSKNFVGEENRQYPRSTVKWPVIIKTSQTSMPGETRDISSGGAFIYCEKPQTPNKTFYLTLHIHPKIISFTGIAEAVWLTPFGMGVRFHLDLPEQHDLLSEFISDACKVS
jgi:hypothetical protein